MMLLIIIAWCCRTHIRGVLLVESSEPCDVLPIQVEVMTIAVDVVGGDEDEW